MAGKKRILCVDDENDVLYFYEQFLTARGYVISKTLIGTEALDMAMLDNYDMIITNINMPGINGIMLLKKLREMGKNLIVIVCTADERHRDDAIKYGCYAYLLKPIILEELEHVVESAFKNGNSNVSHF